MFKISGKKREIDKPVIGDVYVIHGKSYLVTKIVGDSVSGKMIDGTTEDIYRFGEGTLFTVSSLPHHMSQGIVKKLSHSEYAK